MNTLWFPIPIVKVLALGLAFGCQSPNPTDEDNSNVAVSAQAISAPPGICAATPKLDLKVRQVSNQNNQLKYRIQVFNRGTQAVALKDLAIKVWLSDSSSNLVVDKYFGGNVFSGTNTWLFGATQLTGNATHLTALCHDPQRETDWRIAVGSTDTRNLPANGGKWVDVNFGVHKGTNWANFDNFLDDYSQLPAYQGGDTSDKTFNPNDPSTTYGDDIYFALFYKGVPVKEWVSSTEADPKLGQEPTCFRTCLQPGNVYLKPTGDTLDGMLRLMADSPTFASYCLSKQCAPMRLVAGQNEVSVVVKTSGNTANVRTLLSQVTYDLADTASIAGYIPVANLQLLRVHPDVVSVESDYFVKATLDTSRVAVKANLAEALGYSGHGTIVGVVDSGIDWRHHDFQEPENNSIVQGIWDQNLIKNTGEQNPNDLWAYADMNYGVVYSNSQINNAIAASDSTSLVRAIDSMDGHGTHVASCAVGTGVGSGMRGIAPGADLYVVKNNGTATGITAATKYVFQEAKRQGLPAVVNHSSNATIAGPHDGTDPTVQDMLAVLHSYPQGVIVEAAGNEGNKDSHVHGTIATGVYSWVTFTTTYANPADVKSLTLYGWFRPGSSFSGLRLRTDAYKGGAAEVYNVYRILFQDGSYFDPQVVEGDFKVTPTTHVETNKYGKSYFKSEIQVDSLPTPVPSGSSKTITWNLIIDTQTYTDAGGNAKQSSGGTYDIWLVIEGKNNPRHSKFTAIDNGSVTNESSILSNVASHEFVVVGGTDENTSNSIADGSSRGPMPGDSGYVVDLVAPGYDAPVNGIRSASANPPGGPVVQGATTAQGTSLSAPQVAGAIALAFQKNSTLTNDDVNALLHSTADKTGLTLPDHTYGYGKLDALALVNAVPPKPVATYGMLYPVNFDWGAGVNRSPEAVQDGQEGMIVTWSADRDGDGTAHRHQVYFKTVDKTGAQVLADTAVAAEATRDFTTYAPHVAVNSRGQFVIVWSAEKGTTEFEVMARIYNRDGSPLAPPFQVTPGMSGSQGRCHAVFLDDDNIMFLWSSWSGSPMVFEPSKFRVYTISTGTFTTPTNLSSNPGYNAHAASSHGKTVIAWVEDNDSDGDPDIVMKSYAGVSGPLSASPVVLSEDVYFLFAQNEPRVAMNKYGMYAVSWVTDIVFDSNSVDLKVFDTNGTQLHSWTNLAGYFGPSDVGLKENGDAVLVYLEDKFLLSGIEHHVESVRFNVDGTTVQAKLSTQTKPKNDIPSIAMAGGGVAFVVWPEFTVGTERADLSARTVKY
jgi:hypothetical protein